MLGRAAGPLDFRFRIAIVKSRIQSSSSWRFCSQRRGRRWRRAGDLEQDQLVAFHARLAKNGDRATGELGGEQIVLAAADQQVAA